MYDVTVIVSMLIALIVGTVIAIPAYFYIYKKKIGDWIHGRRKNKEDK